MTDLRWRCELHGVTTDSDCPECDDELIALAEETHAGPRCQRCGRLFADGEPGWVEDWKVITPKGVRTETRYTCDECENLVNRPGVQG